MSAFVAALRISRRDALRTKGRTALIMLMIGLPVLIVSGVLTVLTTARVDAREALPYRLGMADAHIRALDNGHPINQSVDGGRWHDPSVGEPRWTTEAVAALVKGTLIPYDSAGVDLVVGGLLKKVDGIELDLRDPMTKGMRTLVEGRFPAAVGEVAVSSQLAEDGARMGETLKASRKGIPLKVVGVIENPVDPAEDEIMALPGAMLHDRTDDDATGWLLDTAEPVMWEQVRRLNAVGLAVQSRALVENPPASAPGALSSSSRDTTEDVVGLGAMVIMIVLETVLMAGPAFAVGLRRRRHELAMLAAQGASPAHLRLVVGADGLVLGGAATLAGTAIGVLGGLALMPLLGGFGLLTGPSDVPWGPVAAVAVLGLVSGIVSALIPAVQAGRTVPAQVLAGRDPVVRDRAGWPILGLLLVAAGGGVVVKLLDTSTVYVLAAGLLVLLGVVVLTPWLVRRTAGLANGRALPVRLAVRDAVRHRGRTSSAVAAVMAVAAAVVALAVGIQSQVESLGGHQDRLDDGTFSISGGRLDEPSWTRLRAEVQRRLPGVRPVMGHTAVKGKDVVEIGIMDQRSGYMFEWDAMIGGPETLELMTGRRDERVAQALSAGKVAVFRPRVVKNGQVALMFNPMSGDAGGTANVPAVDLSADGSGGLSVIPPSAVRALGFEPVPRMMYARYDVPDPERFAGEIKAVFWDADIAFPETDERLVTLRFLIAAAALLMLGGTFVATGLATADMRRDLDTMSAVGAAPRTRRWIVAAQAGYISGLGALTGLLIGLPLGIGLAWPMGAVIIHEPGGARKILGAPLIAIPWVPLALVVVGLPLLAALVAGLCAPTRVRLARRLT
jgi:putative ABC transport system permease protein